jgi:diguanylate cyclase (GGDEF)-like protein
MSWVTDAGVAVSIGGITFMVGSTVFYTSLLLSVFVVYVFDGPRATRVAIFTIIGVSIMVPLIAVTLNLQMKLTGQSPLGYVPTPSLRINAASVASTFVDLVFLAMAWEFLNNRLKWIPMFVRAYLTLLGVMWLDVLLFNTGAFVGQPEYLSIMAGTGLSRLIVSLFAAPILAAYLYWQNRRYDTVQEGRPVMSILRQFAEVKHKLSLAQDEIELRKKAEAALRESREKLEKMATTDDLTGLANRRQFRALAKRELARIKRSGGQLCLIAIDLDGFKRVNDTYGHDMGDQVLRLVADIGRRSIREVDLMGRMGGEEFALLLPQTGLDAALVVAERFRQNLADTGLETDKGRIEITLSAGVASTLGLIDDLDDLLQLADRALYAAKSAGRNTVRAA